MLDEQVVDAVAIGNLKAISEQPAMLSNLAYTNAVATNNLGQQNAVSNQQSGNQLNVSLTAKATNTVSNPGPLEARSAVDVFSNNSLAQTIADLKSSVQAFTAHRGGGWLRRVMDKNVDVDSQGRDVISSDHIVIQSAAPVIFIPGKIASEDIKVELGPLGVTITVTKVG
ncbi:MAG TPA: hypothetical protein VF271_10050 [Rhodanobacteraceae bacterium]